MIGSAKNHQIQITIRWRDMDAYGHVNNAVYLNYLEECRDALAHELFGADAWDFVLAHVGIDYRSQLTQDDGVIGVTCRVDAYGTSSIRTKEQILKADGSVAAEAESVIVPRDERGSRPLTDDERSILASSLAEE